MMLALFKLTLQFYYLRRRNKVCLQIYAFLFLRGFFVIIVFVFGKILHTFHTNMTTVNIEHALTGLKTYVTKQQM